jgi:uncharacterized protein
MENIDHIIAIIKETCAREEKVIATYLFGSSITGQIRSAGDIDVALLLESGQEGQFPLMAFIASLERELKKPVDVILLNRSGEVVKYQVRKYGRLIFQRDPIKRKRFEVISRKFFEDFLFLHRKYVGKVLYGK